MSPLSHTSAQVLEFGVLRDLVRGYAFSPLGQARVSALEPVSDLDWIEDQQQMAAEIREFLRAGGRFDFAGLLDPRKELSQARIEGAVLDPTQIREILLVADRADEWNAVLRNPPNAMRGPEGANSVWPAIARLCSGLADFTELLRAFRNKINPDGTLDDHASSDLARIRREIEKQRRSIRESLNRYLRNLSEGGTLQEELVTIRGERFVIPVKVEQKRRVQGVVHGVSSSGQTVFVEPLETIEQNNELVRLLEDELEEVHRILLEMTRKLGEHAPDIAHATDVLGGLELQFAKARFANEYSCVHAKFAITPLKPEEVLNGPPAFLLFNARHPLLERNLKPKGIAVVPISVELAGDQRQIVITGPNTGGKTVSLKTIGLLALMAQSGIPVPADRAELPLFDAVLADIGDYQSIEQNLSTFSAHVTNIDFISRTATQDSLVLLDELGSATDPEEGAALAVAIADHFRRVGAVSVISTHHTSLKVYGANTPGVLNAAVGFDERTLQPTYELRVGVPGASAGLNIAQRLGLNPSIVDAARSRIGTQTQDVSKFLDRLHSELREVETERADLRHKEQEIARERGRLAAEGAKEQRAKLKEMEQKLDGLIHDLEYRVRETVNAVQDRAAATKLSKDAERRVAKMRREFREQFDNTIVAHTSGADRDDPNARPDLVQHVSEGDTIKLRSVNRTAIVRRKVGEDLFEVEAGVIKMRIPRADIAQVVAHAGDNPVAAARARGINVRLENNDLTAPTELNVIGHNVDDATREVEKFVDRAFLAGMPQVRIVHGSGMGILRKALRSFLQKHPHVANVTEPPQNEGGAGATVVDLRI